MTRDREQTVAIHPPAPIVARGTWSVPAEPGPEVTAVRCPSGHPLPNGFQCAGYLWRRWDDGWGDRVPCMPWHYIVTVHGLTGWPLTDATAEAAS